MTSAHLRLIRNILLRAFFIGLIFAAVFLGLYYAFQNTWISLIVDQWHFVDSFSLNIIVVSFSTLLRFYLFFILLAPALAVHWEMKILESRGK